MKAKFLILSFLLVFFLRLGAHPIHISIVNIDIKEDSNRIDYSIRLFYDDFQALINYEYNTSIDFGSEIRMTHHEQSAILDYIETNFRLLNYQEEIFKSKFVQWKIEEMSIWLFFCTDINSEITELYIENSLMTDLFYDQKNYVIIRHKDVEKGFEFTKAETLQHYIY